VHSFAQLSKQSKIDSLTESLYQTDNPTEKVVTLEKLADMNINDSAKFFTHRLEALEVAKTNNLHSAVSRIYGRIGWWFLVRGNSVAKGYFEKALGIARESNENNEIIAALYNLGVYHRCISDFAGAKAYYEEAISIAKNSKDENGFSGLFNSLVTVYEDMCESAEALSTFNFV